LKKRLESSCSCPSDCDPCKHADALLETYRVSPQSFHDLEATTNEKPTRMKRLELLRPIRRTVVASPTSLSALDVRDFETEGVDEDYRP